MSANGSKPGTGVTPEKTLGFVFSEMMEGPFSLGSTDPKEGEMLGERDSEKLSMRATITISDLDSFIKDSRHAGSLIGEVDFAPLGVMMKSTKGVFNLFSPADDATVKHMVYEIGFESEGRAYYLAGKKLIRQQSVLELWKATTTLYTVLYEGSDHTCPVIGAGILTLSLPELLKMIRTMSPQAHTEAEGAIATARFGKFFLGELWETYFAKAGCL